MHVAEAVGRLALALRGGTLAHGYLVCGDVRGNAPELVREMLKLLFPGAAGQAASGSHPDVHWLHPQGASRTIKITAAKEDDGPGLREGLLEPMSVTSFSGGWKVGVIVGADRMQPVAANAFLKTLEEPPPKTVFFLLTDAPDAVLPTILSRTQRIDLPRQSGGLDGEARAEVLEVLADAASAPTTFRRAQSARRLAKALDGLKKASEEGDAPQVRKAFFRTVLGVVQEWMVVERLPRWQAFRDVEIVEEAYRQSERALSDDAVLGFMLDRLVFPPVRERKG